MDIFDLSKASNETLFLVMIVMFVLLIILVLIISLQKQPTYKSIEEINKKEKEIKNKKGQLLCKQITYEYRLTDEDGYVSTRIRTINTNYM